MGRVICTVVFRKKFGLKSLDERLKSDFFLLFVEVIEKGAYVALHIVLDA